jgi:UDP:flavonoid glycosyltransferase YjiC (YdhE family)
VPFLFTWWTGIPLGYDFSVTKLRAIVIGLGSAGDVHPNVGLALALRQRGADVLFAAPEVFRQLAERTRLEFYGIGTREEFEEALRDPDLWHPTRSFQLVARKLIVPAMRPIYDLIAKNFVQRQTVVAASGMAFGARIAQEKLGVPLATVHLQPIMFRSSISPGCFGFPDILTALPRPLRPSYFRLADRLIVDRPLIGPVNQFRAELGLSPVKRFFNGWLHSPQLTIGLVPEWFAEPQPDWPPNVSLTGFPLWDESEVRTVSPELEQFLAEGAPPILFTAGSAMLHADDFFKTSVEVCGISGWRGLLVTQFPEQLPPKLPNNVRHFEYIPFSAVLSRTAAIVHHGGIGTTSQAMLAGIPQLIVPFSHDQPDNAVRVRRLGIGDYVLPRAYSTKRVIEKLKRLMRPEIYARCKQTSEMVERDSLQRASELIERLAGSATGAAV